MCLAEAMQFPLHRRSALVVGCPGPDRGSRVGGSTVRGSKDIGVSRVRQGGLRVRGSGVKKVPTATASPA